jgi:ankyrin repeat protein
MAPSSPLHVACKRAYLHIDRLVMFPRASDDALNERDESDGLLSLHLLCAREEVTVELLEAALLGTRTRAADREADKDGRLPLHILCENEAITVELLETLLSAHADAAKEADIRGRLPLHCLCSNKAATADLLCALLDAHPAAAKEKDLSENGSRLPLHLLCSNEAVAVEAIAALLGAHAGAAETRDGYGQLPIHRRCRVATVALDELDALLGAHPAAAAAKDRENRLPLHFLSENAAALARAPRLLNTLLQAQPGAACQKTKPGRLPLHILCGNKVITAELPRTLLSAHADAAKEADKDGRLPLHFLCRNKALSTSVGSNTSPSVGSNASLAATELANAPIADDSNTSRAVELVVAYLRGAPIDALRVRGGDSGVDLIREFVRMGAMPGAMVAAAIVPLAQAEEPRRQLLLQACAQYDLLPQAKALIEQKLAHIDKPSELDPRPPRGIGMNSANPECRRFYAEQGLLLGRFRLAPGPPLYRSATAVVLRARDYG